MNKYDFAKSILDQLGQDSRLKKDPGLKELNQVQYNQRVKIQNPGKGEKAQNLKLLAVFTGTNVGIEKALMELKKLHSIGVSFDVAFSWNGKDLLDIKHIQQQLKAQNVFTEIDKGKIDLILERVEGIVIPMATQNTTAKLSQGIQDDFISTLLWQNLWRGRKMVLNVDNVVAYKGQQAKVPQMQQMIEGMIEKLTEIGVEILRGQEYLPTVRRTFGKVGKDPLMGKNAGPVTQNPFNRSQSPGEKMIITEKDIIYLNSPSKILSVSNDAIITPSAYDRAKAMGIEIKKLQE